MAVCVATMEVRCRACGASTWHSTSAIERLRELEDWPNASGVVNYACPSCHTLSQVKLGAEDTHKIPDALMDPDSTMDWCVFVDCSEPNCRPVLVLTPAEIRQTVPGLMLQARAWTATTAACRGGHTPALPVRVRGIQRLS